MFFYYVRHGDPIYDPDSLTPIGHKQAEALAKRLSLYGMDEIYSSTSIRAQMTAQPTCDILKKEKTLLDWTNEAHVFSEFSVKKEDGNRTWVFHSQKYRDILNASQVRDLGSKWYTHPKLAGDNFEKGVKRVDAETDAFLLQLGFRHDRENACYEVVRRNDKRIALFAHEGFGKAFLSSLLDIPYPQVALRLELGHSSVTVIHFDENAEKVIPRVLQWSNDSHLYKEEILTGYHNVFDI